MKGMFIAVARFGRLRFDGGSAVLWARGAWFFHSEDEAHGNVGGKKSDHAYRYANFFHAPRGGRGLIDTGNGGIGAGHPGSVRVTPRWAGLRKKSRAIVA